MKDRMTTAQLAKRTEKRGYRLGLMQHIGETRRIAQACASVLSRGFFGRAKWAAFGR